MFKLLVWFACVQKYRFDGDGDGKQKSWLICQANL